MVLVERRPIERASGPRSGIGQKHYKLLRLLAAKSTTEHMGNIVPTADLIA